MNERIHKSISIHTRPLRSAQCLLSPDCRCESANTQLIGIQDYRLLCLFDERFMSRNIFYNHRCWKAAFILHNTHSHKDPFSRGPPHYPRSTPTMKCNPALLPSFTCNCGLVQSFQLEPPNQSKLGSADSVGCHEHVRAARALETPLWEESTFGL